MPKDGSWLGGDSGRRRESLGPGSPPRSAGLSEVWSLDLGMQGFPFPFLGKGDRNEVLRTGPARAESLRVN